MSKRILILENDPDILDIMQEILNYEGFDVKPMSENDDVFKRIEEYDPDLVMIDYLLNGINGGEICAQIKKHPSTSELPVVLISAYSRVLLSLGTYGCDDFIAKPFELSDLINRIRTLVEKPQICTVN
ncbi:response regulator [Mucilaginibacter sp. Bleaf8]|uniref:response regulator n=1 Tax=Mucilaginibacter sp. Bleaf8 TaxID=2834430 RepID=UPI001BCF6841|nr:response regulator [Mucilaginibacter sp. Bleaf8]MBS7565033.1 response regulator [Mucilaginibacter sp. Bleaf8]